MAAQRKADASTIAMLVNANKKLTNGLAALTLELKRVEEATQTTTTAQCTPLADPANGSVDWIGDHGDNVPISVTATYLCQAGFYVKGDDAETTCQQDGDSGAKWSAPAKHPGCGACPKDCTQCTTNDKCDVCNDAATLDESSGKCIFTPGLTKATAAESCKAILDANPAAATVEGGYWIKTLGDTVRKMWCMMSDTDRVTGGGWTLVGRGVGGHEGCWLEGGDEDCNPNSMVDTRRSFIYADEIINSIDQTTIWYQGFGSTRANWYFKSGGSNCNYGHVTDSKGECNCAHAQADFSDSCPDADTSKYHHGVGSWNKGNQNGFLHSSFSMPRSTCTAQQSSTLEMDTGKGLGKVGTCVFPFNYGSTTYWSCGDTQDYGNVGWCAFDRQYQSGEWGYCTDECPKEEDALRSHSGLQRSKCFLDGAEEHQHFWHDWK